MIELLKRLEAKGVPLKTSKDGFGELYLNLWKEEDANHAYREDGTWRHHTDWLIIGCVIEYMEAQEHRYTFRRMEFGYMVCFTKGSIGHTAKLDTLLEAVLEAADEALP